MKHNNFKTFRSIGCKHYAALVELFRSSTATGALRISPTDPLKSPGTYERMEEQFLAAQTSRGKEPIDLEEGSDDSNDLECIDLFKSSLNMKKKESTPPKSKRSKFVTSSEKPAKNSIKEAMTLLKDMKDTIFVDKYLAAASVLPMGQRDVSSCAITIRLSGNGCVALLALERTRCIYSFVCYVCYCYFVVTLTKPLFCICYLSNALLGLVSF
ncbi:hypothetical protein CRG98_018101 [Punica granatum]|uniref:Uncharacterized protein n=1 Tax=Punica granatum TaxID=22663 RepID=A0A2I0JYW6_PUNGR|nr:hypothetical protein CRG98_018101 [Punica granatum]